MPHDTKFTLYAHIIPANVPGPLVLPIGGKAFNHDAKPWRRVAFYATPDDTLPCVAWNDCQGGRRKKTQVLDGLRYRLIWF